MKMVVYIPQPVRVKQEIYFEEDEENDITGYFPEDMPSTGDGDGVHVNAGSVGNRTAANDLGDDTVSQGNRPTGRTRRSYKL